ncbi:DUF5677 domain-containing protein [Sphingomonas sp. IC-56]|uniref:DUF5677 domain-containing protein n=1 Tax=Sphingomonas sp. IC-56 TaxID=2898529 RepID=UPI001E44CB6D
MELSSWRDERLPEVIWAALICTRLTRDLYLGIFRDISIATKDNSELVFEGMGHSRLAKLSADEFKTLLAPVLNLKDAVAALAPLRLLPDLPDIQHWLPYIPDITNTQEAWTSLAEAIAANSWHQSESATDIRWLKVITMITAGKINYPGEMAESFQSILGYPAVGDMRKVRPLIRATEMAFAMPIADPTSSHWPLNFWKVCLNLTGCVPAPIRQPQDINVSKMIDETIRIYAVAAEHFHNSISTTDIDDRLDGTFGLTLYGIVTQITLLMSDSHQRVQGRLLVRTLVEIYITLSFLIKKDDDVFWKRYRNYGSGQAKLAYLKLIDLDSDEVPSYVRLNELEELANEDRWQEFVEIDLGNWAKLDLRRMSEEAGVKDVYDRYYSWPSGFVHGQWSAVRDTVFDLCVNPLHRYHRIPSPPRLDMGSVAPDGAKLVNLILDLLNQAYPPFKPRLKVKHGIQD